MLGNVLAPHVLVTASALAVALVQAATVKTPAPPPAARAPSAATRPAPAGRRVFVTGIAWSPDGRRIAFSRYAGEGAFEPRQRTLWVADRDGSNPRALLAGAASPSFSPDGTRLAVAMRVDGNEEIVTVRADGGDPGRVTERTAGRVHAPAWSRDGRFLVFNSEVNGNLDLYRIDADGRGLRRLTTDPARDYNPEVSPDGRSVVFYREIGDQHDQIWTLELGTGLETRVTDGTGHNFYPTFLPDGRIAFAGSFGGERRLMVQTKDGRFEPVGPPGVYFARWLPDGREILFLLEGRTTLQVMAADGTGIKVLLDASALPDPPL